jgi:hypothetical protein
MVAFGVIMELFALGHSIREGRKLEQAVALSQERVSTNELEVASLRKATIELAHQYDLSTNALAEANARLATIKPIKERLIDFLNGIGARIIPAFRQGQTNFKYAIPLHQYSKLRELSDEPGASVYLDVKSNQNGNTVFNDGEPTMYGTLELKPPLLQ